MLQVYPVYLLWNRRKTTQDHRILRVQTIQTNFDCIIFHKIQWIHQQLIVEEHDLSIEVLPLFLRNNLLHRECAFGLCVDMYIRVCAFVCVRVCLRENSENDST